MYPPDLVVLYLKRPQVLGVRRHSFFLKTPRTMSFSLGIEILIFLLEAFTRASTKVLPILLVASRAYSVPAR